ncbi:hypothetical protein SS1G_06315 [Sclerotinia sclerotiorum 1980 UF-70]|uniref:Uncharacterized protein n=2 Tax=Sclerotinia sclerotiorum (strain ATCC 18683 / 1980 / Ss-1) TaxID=665079 RepID=A7ELW8_SCLS1|nr:hypothetical protein SS1G_06315 [Sclerotinia sclerotiorum 1980 UF-70]APA09547.1 hypothetical protein sscle_05g043170 [Sclerotinia sclerotiorum 1980 UF-70]EDO03834.1 hypothetical protein SS1G_06315 [Sclerotinia sclerotiorum 1980 UF-70]
MDVDNDEEILRALAHGQPIDYSTWPSLLERLMIRLEKIAITDFQIPKLPTYARPSSPSISPKQDTSNEGPSSDFPPSLESLPSICYKQLLDIQNTLNKTFPTHPPHTIQRLSELLLNPTQHHRSLPSYLHALDRVIHVTSPITAFPLPPAIPDPRVSSSVLSNGTPPSVDPLSISWSNPTSGTASVNGGLGSDEALGGALLTPISWLNKRESSLTHNGSNGTSSGGASPRGEVRTESTETIDGPNGPGGVETVSVSVNGISSVGSHVIMSLLSSSVSSLGEQGLRAEGGVTQGELLRQEQKAGVVPASQLRVMQRESDREDWMGRRDENGMGEEDELPHARGPEEIGMEDMGPQERGKVPVTGGGIDVEAAVGRRPDYTEEKEVEEKTQKEDGEVIGKSNEDADGDAIMNVDVKEEGGESTSLKRAAEDDIGSEAGEKRVKEEMEIEPNPDSAIKPDNVKEEENENVMQKKENTMMKTDMETDTKTEVVEANEKKESVKGEIQGRVDEAVTQP